jgi:hypothetical protein
METTIYPKTNLPKGFKIFEAQVFTRENRFRTVLFAAKSKASVQREGARKIKERTDYTAPYAQRVCAEILQGEQSLKWRDNDVFYLG